MAINSIEKGKAGEREFANFCKKHGIKGARRGQQYSGIEGKDVVGLNGIHVEVKRVERLNVSKAMEQSMDDSKDNEIPIVAHRKNREPWYITMRAEDWIMLYKSTRSGGNQKEKQGRKQSTQTDTTCKNHIQRKPE